MEKMSFTKAIASYFGKQPNQTAGDFLKEIKALTPKDREDLTRDFRTVGIEIEQQIAA